MAAYDYLLFHVKWWLRTERLPGIVLYAVMKIGILLLAAAGGMLYTSAVSISDSEVFFPASPALFLVVIFTFLFFCRFRVPFMFTFRQISFPAGHLEAAVWLRFFSSLNLLAAVAFLLPAARGMGLDAGCALMTAAGFAMIFAGIRIRWKIPACVVFSLMCVGIAAAPWSLMMELINSWTVAVIIGLTGVLVGFNSMRRLKYIMEIDESSGSNLLVTMPLRTGLDLLFLELIFLLRSKKWLLVQAIGLIIIIQIFLFIMFTWNPFSTADRESLSGAWQYSLFLNVLSALYIIFIGPYSWGWYAYYYTDIQAKNLSVHEIIQLKADIMSASVVFLSLLSLPLIVSAGLDFPRFIGFASFNASFGVMMALLSGALNFGKLRYDKNPYNQIEGDKSEQYLIMWVIALLPVGIFESVSYVMNRTSGIISLLVISVVLFIFREHAVNKICMYIHKMRYSYTENRSV